MHRANDFSAAQEKECLGPSRPTGSECWEVYDDDRLVARIVPHDTGVGWKGVDLTGKALTKQPYPTPEIVLRYLPVDL